MVIRTTEMAAWRGTLGTPPRRASGRYRTKDPTRLGQHCIAFTAIIVCTEISRRCDVTCIRLQNVTLETLPRAERENWQKMRFFPHSAAQGHQTRKRIPASLGICRCWPWGAVSPPNCETRGRKSQKS